jgi:hypothetical protein
MEKSAIKPATAGDPSTLVLSLAADATSDDRQFFAVPIAVRHGGILLALPEDTFTSEDLAAGQAADDEAVIGPSTVLSLELLEEDEDGMVQRTGFAVSTLCVDLSDGIISSLREYDPVTDSTENIIPFHASYPNALPNLENALGEVMTWAETAAARANFYSARDEQVPITAAKKAAAAAAKKANVGGRKQTTAALAEQVQSLTAQMASLMESQRALHQHLLGEDAAKAAPAQMPGGLLSGPKMPALSSSLSPPKAATLGALAKALGPPPKTKLLHAGLGSSTLGPDEPFDALMSAEPPSQDTMLAALTQQSAAVTALVAHIAGGGDAMTDLHGSVPGSLGASTKGLQRRQKLQADLASQSSPFFMQLHQQMHRKMFPAKVVPQKEEDLFGSQMSMCSYLERFGNFKNAREVGMTMWVLGHAIDAAAQGDHRTCQEFLALLALALEQVSTDGDWRIAYHLTLLEEPPSVMFQGRPQAVSAVGKPFANLVPPTLAATTLAYIKEVDVLLTKKGELKGGRKPTGATGDPEEERESASPKRKPRFPRKPKQNEEGGS